MSASLVAMVMAAASESGELRIGHIDRRLSRAGQRRHLRYVDRQTAAAVDDDDDDDGDDNRDEHDRVHRLTTDLSAGA